MKTLSILIIIFVLTIASFGEGLSESDPVIARVLDREIKLSEQNDLTGIIFGTLLQQYAQDHAIAATQADIDAFVERSKQQQAEQNREWEAKRHEVQNKLKSKDISSNERDELKSELEMYDQFLGVDEEMAEYAAKQPEESRRAEEGMAESFVQAWKVNQALYRQYGGRVIFQQAGVEPLDAYRQFLRDQEKAGRFEIIDKQYEASLWNYFTNDTMHTFYSEEEGDKFINTPWWLMSNQEE